MSRSGSGHDRLLRTMFGGDAELSGQLVGQLALAKEYITGDQFEECLGELLRLKASGQNSNLGMLLLKRGYLTMDRYLELLGEPDEAVAATTNRIGRYRVEREIARGAMGIVFEAVDPELNRRVALKVIREGEASRQAIERLHREAAIVAQLRHPNIVTVHDVGVSKDAFGNPIHFIAMDYVKGGTLHEIVRDPRVPRPERLRMLEEVARAVAYAHAHGILHRDLKPSNVLVGEDRRAVLTDFGIAHAENFRTRLTRSMQVLGTPQYMAPEQVEGKAKEIDVRTDVYSLGVMLYEILRGRPPFVAETPARLYDLILRGEPTPPGVGKDLDAICLKAMARERERRYATAREFADDLARARRGEPVQARPPSRWYRWRKKLGRSKSVGLAAALLAAVATLVVIARPGKPQPLPKDDAYLRKLRLREEKLKPLMGKIQETRPFFYIQDTPTFRNKIAEVETALEELERLAEDPDNGDFADLWALLGSGWYFVGAEVRAERALRTAQRLAAGEGQVDYVLARICVERVLSEMTRDPDYLTETRRHRAQELMMRVVLPKEAREIDRHLAAAYRALVECRWDEVCCLAQEGIDRFPAELGREEFWLLLGCAQVGGDAIKSLTRAIEIRPQYAWAYVLRAGRKWDARDLPGAIDDCSRALEIQPRCLAAYYNRGGARFEKGDFEAAAEDCTRAIDLDPEPAHGYYTRALARQAQKDLEGALVDYGEAIRLDPKFRAPRNNRGMLRHLLGDLEGALADLDEALRIDARYVDAYYNRAIVKADLGDLEGARADYTRAIELSPKNANLYYKRGRVNDRRGDFAGALADFTVAIRLDPRMADAYNSRGSVRFGRRDFFGALADFSGALRLRSRDATAWLNRGLARARLRQTAAAIADIEQALRVASRDWPGRSQAIDALKVLRQGP